MKKINSKIPKFSQGFFLRKFIVCCPIFFLCLFFCCDAQLVRAQSTINATGGNNIISGNYYAYSIAEMVVVGTESNGSIIVTQGVLQPVLENTGILEVNSSKGSLKVYPNPASDYLILKPDLVVNSILTYELFDITGRMVLRKTVHLNSGKEQQRIEVGDLSSGNYLLKTYFKLNNTPFIENFKIQKL